ncbi:hypothetical protein Syun_025517 [Stephania yunnanensis]|uniref:Uncharacterized protein n=1 Tax=Stephania yunnanensis TaxID=152371 RepID=A0AAP0HUX8_9MAGN
MMGLAFDKVSRRWVEKGPNKDEDGEGDGGREDGSDDEDEESGKVNFVPILDNDSEVRGYGHCDSIEGREAVTLTVERVEIVNVESTQNETKLFPTCTIGAFSSQQFSNLLRSFLDELKATVENRLDHIGAVMQMVHKNMSTLLKKAAELRKKTKTSRKMMKEFIDRLDHVVEECDRALKDRIMHKKWKSKYQPNKGNHS